MTGTDLTDVDHQTNPVPAANLGTILIIEDDTEIREALTDILEFEGYEVMSVKNGQEGMNYLNQSPRPALILLDFMMPVMNGWQFRNAQKQDPLLADIPVVVLSADNAIDKKAQQVEANGFLKKPIELDHLLDMIKQYC